MARLIKSQDEWYGLHGFLDDLDEWKKKAEETFGIDIDQQVKNRAQAEYLKQIKPYMPWVRDRGKYLGCEIARGFEEELPSIRIGGAGVRRCTVPPKKLNKKQMAAKMLADPIINEFRIGVAEGAKSGIKARMTPYFIVLPVLGFLAGTFWAGRKK